MGKVTFKAIMGLLAGAVAWACVEPFKPNFADQVAWGKFESVLMVLFGLLIGGVVGGMSGFQRGGIRHTLKEGITGAVLGVLGILIGRALLTPLNAAFPTWQSGASVIFFRAIMFTILGAGLGIGIGFSSLVPRRGLQGLVGGAIGGAIAGSIFDIVGSVLASVTLMSQGVDAGKIGEVGGPSRALMGASLGFFIALLIGIIEQVSRSAWVRLELGRNEGREWALDKQTMIIGRSEQADIPIFGDMNIAPQHAVIQNQGGQYVVFDNGTPLGIGVNGQRVQQSVLMPGSVIQVGGSNLVFQMKNQATPNRGPEPLRGNGFVPAPMVMPAAPQVAITPSPTPAPRIIAIDSPLQGQVFMLPVELGRDSTHVLMAFDGGTSRRHAKIDVSGQIEDLQSTNGTFVNGQRVTLTTLRQGDIIKIGSTSFRFEAS